MSEVTPEFVGSRLDRLSGSLVRLRVLLALAGGFILGLGAWAWDQSRDLKRAHEESMALRADLDMLRAAQRATEVRVARGIDQVATIEGRMDRAARGVRHAELVAVRGWIRRLEDRIVGNEEHLNTLERRLVEGLAGVRDSSTASRAHLEAVVAGRFAAAAQARAELAGRQAALSHRIDAAEQRDRRRMWRRAARDVLTVVSAGVVVPHVLDHHGR